MSKNKKVTNNPDPEAVAKPKRRTFTKEYKQRILKEYTEAEVGKKGAILHRKSVYSSNITNWRRQTVHFVV
jgi:transposase-like protein